MVANEAASKGNRDLAITLLMANSIGKEDAIALIDQALAFKKNGGWRRSLRMLGWGPWLKLALLPLQDELVTKDGGLAHRRPGPSPPTPTSGTWKSADV
jgi:hypothetical protein